MLWCWSLSYNTTMHITCFRFRSIQTVHPSVLLSIYFSALNWKVIGQVRVAADKACLADVTRKHEHNGSNWTDWWCFHNHRWSPVEERKLYTIIDEEKDFRFTNSLLDEDQKWTSGMLKIWSFCTVKWCFGWTTLRNMWYRKLLYLPLIYL